MKHVNPTLSGILSPPPPYWILLYHGSTVSLGALGRSVVVLLLHLCRTLAVGANVWVWLMIKVQATEPRICALEMVCNVYLGVDRRDRM